MKAHCAEAPAAPTAGSRKHGRPAPEMSACHTSGSCFQLLCGDRNRSGWYNIPTGHAGSCPQSRLSRDAGRKRLVRPGTGGARTGSRGIRRSKGHTRRPVQLTRLRRWRRWSLGSGRRSSQQALHVSFAQDRELFANAQADALGEHIVLAGCDSLEQTPVDRDQHPERRLAVFGDQRDQLFTGTIAFARSLRLLRQQRTYAACIGSGEVGSREAEFSQILLWKIEAAHGDVFLDVANDVGELKRQPAFLRQWFGRGIAIAKDLDADESHDRRYAVAILPQFFESTIARSKNSSLLGGGSGFLFHVRRRSVGQLVEQSDRNLVAALGIGQSQQ